MDAPSPSRAAQPADSRRSRQPSPLSTAETRLRSRICIEEGSSEARLRNALLLSDDPPNASADSTSGFPPGAIASPSAPHQTWTERFQPAAAEAEDPNAAEGEAASKIATSAELPPQPEDDEDSLSVFVGTWNLAGEPWPEKLDQFLHPEKGYDVYAIGTEECGCSITQAFLFPSKQKWVEAVQATLPSHQLISQETLVATHIAVFVKKELIPLVSGVESSYVATGIGNTLGNKGGVGVGFTVATTSFLFINAHFAAHQNKVADRNRDFQRINQSLELGRNNPNKHRALVEDRFDRVFWSGDLNYRIDCNRQMADQLLAKQLVEVLVANDQLLKEMKAGRVFEKWTEGPLTFQPTYKLDFGSERGTILTERELFGWLGNTVYDTSSKARIPAWTDRVLWLPRPEIRLEIYTCVKEIVTSDHLPVFATFKVGCDVANFELPPEQDQSQTSSACVMQ